MSREDGLRTRGDHIALRVGSYRALEHLRSLGVPASRGVAQDTVAADLIPADPDGPRYDRALNADRLTRRDRFETMT